jgi:orotate phosphoribosyltransferase
MTAAEARERLVRALRDEALVIGEVTLTSGQVAQYLVDVKRAVLLREGFLAAGALIAEQARALGATAVGGLTMGADPLACAALAGGADVKAFFVRKEAKDHGLSRRIEGPLLVAGADRCLIVEDVVTTGGSTIKAIEAVRSEGLEVCGVVAICDRLAGGADAIRAAAGAPYVALTTIDDVYPGRPDKESRGRRPARVTSAGRRAACRRRGRRPCRRGRAARGRCGRPAA